MPHTSVGSWALSLPVSSGLAHTATFAGGSAGLERPHVLAAGPLGFLPPCGPLLPRWPVRGGLRAGLQKDEAGAGRHLEVWRLYDHHGAPSPHSSGQAESQGPPRPTSEPDSASLQEWPRAPCVGRLVSPTLPIDMQGSRLSSLRPLSASFSDARPLLIQSLK